MSKARGRRPRAKKIRSYRDLDVWQRAIELAVAVNEILRRAPRRSIVGVGGQLRRAAESVSSLVSEGHGRPTRQDYAHHVGMALAEIREVEDHLHTLEKVRGVRGPFINLAVSLTDECARMLVTLHRRLTET